MMRMKLEDILAGEVFDFYVDENRDFFCRAEGREFQRHPKRLNVRRPLWAVMEFKCDDGADVADTNKECHPAPIQVVLICIAFA